MKPILQHVLCTALLCSTASIQSVNAEVQPFISGGKTVAISDLPSTVALLNQTMLAMTGSAYESQFCGGTLLSSTWVLTAAHCVVDEDGVSTKPDEMSVLAGSGNLEYPNFEPIPVIRIIVHEDYRSSVIGDDIALLEIAEPAPAQAIAISHTPVESGEPAYIAGWGWLDYAANRDRARSPKELQMAIVGILTGDECTAIGGRFPAIDADKQFCAASLSDASSEYKNASTCFGDSGGPIYTVNSRSELTLAGVASMAAACGRYDLPGIYTNVLHYTNWINSYITGMISVADSTDAKNRSGSTDGNNTTDAMEIDEGNHSVTTEPTFERLKATGSTSYLLLPLLSIVLFLRNRRSSNKLLQSL